MKQVIKKIFVKFLICALAVGMFWAPHLTFAQNSDPAITDFVMINSTPSPNEEVDFIVSYANGGSVTARNVELVIDYNETKLENISLGDTEHCLDTEVTIRCYFEEIEALSSNTIGFTATVASDIKEGTEITMTAVIEERGNENDDTQNNVASAVITVGPSRFGGISMSEGLPESFREAEILETPSPNQTVALFDVTDNPDWQASTLYTTGLKFIIRGKEALAWSLGIEDAGFHNPAIRSSYLKVLTIVNSLFIIGLLAIAAMWMFSILIPRRYLKKVVLIYGIAVIFVNFALPLNQLFIDGTNLLQNTLLNGVDITSIAKTPSYNDEGAVGYQNETGFLKQSTDKNLNFNFADESAEEIPSDVVIGRIGQNPPNPQGPDYIGNITFPITDAEGTIIGTEGETIQLRSTADQVFSVNTDQSIKLTEERTFNPDQEHSIFAFLMMLLTGLAYFVMALVFVLRIVILWALMIVSPVLFLLAIFHATRSYFINWLGLYARWLLVGPLMALGLSIVVNIWQAVGLPITSSYAGVGAFGILTNIGFYLPGKEVVNNLSTTPQMMEYLIFLIMLYLPLFFAFVLTRQKLWSLAPKAFGAGEKREVLKTQAGTAEAAPVGEAGKKAETAEAKLLPGGIRGFLTSKLAGLTKTAMPETMTGEETKGVRILETASSFLPAHLALANTRDMLDTIAGAKGSRNAHKKAVERLADPENIADASERQKVMAVRQEINERADHGDADAMRIVNEIKEQEQVIVTGGQIIKDEEIPIGALVGAPIGALVGAPIEVETPEYAPTTSEVTEIAKGEIEKALKKEAESLKPSAEEEEEEEIAEEEAEEAEEEKEEK